MGKWNRPPSCSLQILKFPTEQSFPCFIWLAVLKTQNLQYLYCFIIKNMLVYIKAKIWSSRSHSFKINSSICCLFSCFIFPIKLYRWLNAIYAIWWMYDTHCELTSTGRNGKLLKCLRILITVAYFKEQNWICKTVYCIRSLVACKIAFCSEFPDIPDSTGRKKKEEEEHR